MRPGQKLQQLFIISILFVIGSSVNAGEDLMSVAKRFFSIFRPSEQSNNSTPQSCTTPDGAHGLCMDITDCPSILFDFGQLLRFICHKRHFTLGICCPIKKSFITTTSTDSTITENPDDKNKKSVTSLTTNTTDTTYSETPKPVYAFKCGTQEVTTARIINGTVSYPGKWPWMAAIYFQGPESKNFHCGGTIISRRYVMTAAHCMRDKEDNRFSPRQFSVRVGDSDISSFSDRLDKYAREHKVMAIMVHPYFESFEYQYFKNDLALLKLISMLDLSPFALPVCLPSKALSLMPTDALSGTMATVIGYGRTSHNEPPSKKILEAVIPVWCNKDCNDSYLPPILETMVCAGYVEGGVDSCGGDSGGPLLIQRNGRWIQLGIVSFGKKCAEPGYPGVYTRVPKFLAWIKEQIESSV